MEGTKPYAARARTVSFLSRAAVIAAMLVGGSITVPGLSRGEDPSSQTRALFEAVERNDLSAVRATVADGARIEARSPFGMRPVDLAIDKGHYEIAHYLLSLHNVRDSTNATSTEGSAAANLPEAAPTSDTVADILSQPLSPPPPSSAEPPPPPDIFVSNPREDDPASTARPAEPAAPPPVSEPDMMPTDPVHADPVAAPSGGGRGILARTSLRIKQAAHSFDETFDTFLGGWFFRWMGRKMARTDHQDAGDGTIAVADLAMSGGEAAPPQTPEPALPPTSDIMAESADVAPFPKASPEAAPPPETTEPVVTAGVAEKDVPALESVSAPEPVASPVTAIPEPPVSEPSVQPLPAVAVATPKIQDIQPKAPTTSRLSSPTPPPASPTAPLPVRRAVDPIPRVAAAADPFAPDSVVPGTRHPVIGDKPPPPPPIPPVERPEASASSPTSNLAGMSAKPATPPAKPAPSGSTSKRPAATANSTSVLDQLAETPKPAKTASAATRVGRPLSLDGPADTVGVAPVRTAMASPPTPPRRAPDSVLTLGESAYISAAMPPESADPSERNFCVKKGRGAVVFCVEPVDWPAKLARQLRVNSIMYQGAQAIVRYDNGIVTRIQAIFPTESHSTLITHYTQRFGKPTATSEQAITPFAQPRQSNQVASWQRVDPLTHEKTTLEIRRYDDTRGSFPDMRHGAILLYNAASPPIFPVLSTLDLMPTSAQ
ncbi:MAG: hypothetical protein IH626_10580 [Rhodospirillales bacterium]|nr:hypothetical protein [Rhodospirillales bacterium]